MIETTEMGALFKKFRLSKKLALKDVAGDYLSISFLSKFERGESEISLSRFLLLLENLDVSIEEFYGILSKEKTTYTELLLERVSKAYYQNNILALKKYLKEENKKLFLYNTIMIESFLSTITEEDVDEDKIKIITDYLFDIEQWGKRELIILGNSMPTISSETLNVLVKEVIYRTTLFGNNESNLKIRIDLLINATSEFIERNQLDLAKSYLDIISDIGIPELFLYEKLEYNILLGAFWIKSGKVEIGKKLIENCLSILKTLGANNLLVSHEAYYEELLNSTI